MTKLLFEKGKELEGSPMLFELVAVLPDLLAEASKPPVQQALPPPGEQQAQAADGSRNEPLQGAAAQPGRQGQRRQHSHRPINIARESAMLQVGLCCPAELQVDLKPGCLKKPVKISSPSDLVVHLPLATKIHENFS